MLIMKLTKIFTGKTKDIDIRGHSVTTAYLKEPVDGRIRVNKDGVEGNEVAVHTDAVYAITEEHYAYWVEQLGEDSCDWSPGIFAENFLISGLNEEQLQVGDVLAIGDEVRLSVAGPRVPCFKLCWRLQQPDSFIQKFATSGKSGVYFNVEQTGTVKAGDAVSLVAKASDSVKITDISNTIFGALVDLSSLQKTLALPGLSEISTLLLRNKLYQILDQQRVTQHRWDDWREVKVDSVIDETPDIKSFYLSSVDDQPLAPYRAGQFLMVQLPTSKETITRVWSLSDYQDQAKQYRLSIKKELEGLGSGYMHEQISDGSRLLIKPPLGRFVLDRSGFKPVLMIAGGIGITPLLSMLKAQVERGEKMPPLYFIHCCQNSEAQPFRQELDRLSERYDITMLHVYDQPKSVDTLGKNYDIEGYLGISHIEEMIAGSYILHGGKKVDMPLTEFDIYMCGPPIFQEKIQQALLSAGANATRLFQESFQANAGDQMQGQIETAQVVFSQSGKTVTWNAETGGSLLDLAESVGLKPDNACRMGVCQSCSAVIKEGAVFYEYSLTHSPEEGQVLLCSAKPASKNLVLEL